MKISLNWLKDYINLDGFSPEQIGDILTEIGLEVEGMSHFESVPGGLEGVVIGKVLECIKHPNADKLSLTKVDIGAEEAVQIVCGAPNVGIGQTVPVATIGTTLYSAEGEAWKIKKGKIRGEVSMGMICAEDELGLGQSHAGIMILPDELNAGLKAAEYFKIEKDFVYEIGLTPNRSDATGHIGVAKDLAAALKINYNHEGEIKYPSDELNLVKKEGPSIKRVQVLNEADCPRFSGVSLGGIQVKSSPGWLQNRLKAIGVRPINNIVDITNYVLHEFGQPHHAYDLDKIDKQEIIVQNLPEGSKFTTLDEVERSLSKEDLMVCDGASNGMCIGGVFGGISSGVKDETKNIFLEAAHFSPRTIRRSSTRHLLRTDAAICFEKGADPNGTRLALIRAANLMGDLAEAHMTDELIDIYPSPVEPRSIQVSAKQVNRLIGHTVENLDEIFQALNIRFDKQGDDYTVFIPTDKADVTREVDVIEEVLRIYGYNKVPYDGQMSMTVTPMNYPSKHQSRQRVADYLSSVGFNECMSLSIVNTSYYEQGVFHSKEKELVRINNTSNINLDVMRDRMVVSALDNVRHNNNRQQRDLRLFEFGRTYRAKEKDSFVEEEKIYLVTTGNSSQESWLQIQREADYYNIKTYISNMARIGGVNSLGFELKDDPTFSFVVSVKSDQQEIGFIGTVAPDVLEAFDIRQKVWYAELNWDAIATKNFEQKTRVSAISKFPTVRRDLALVVDNRVNFKDISYIAFKFGKRILKDLNLFDVYQNEEQLGEGKKSYAVSFVFENHEKTLKDKEVDQLMKKLIQTYEGELGAYIRN